MARARKEHDRDLYDFVLGAHRAPHSTPKHSSVESHAHQTPHGEEPGSAAEEQLSGNGNLIECARDIPPVFFNARSQVPQHLKGINPPGPSTSAGVIRKVKESRPSQLLYTPPMKRQESNRTNTMKRREDNRTNTMKRQESNRTNTMKRQEDNRTNTMKRQEDNRTNTMKRQEDNRTNTMKRQEDNRTNTMKRQEDNKNNTKGILNIKAGAAKSNAGVKNPLSLGKRVRFENNTIKVMFSPDHVGPRNNVIANEAGPSGLNNTTYTESSVSNSTGFTGPIKRPTDKAGEVDINHNVLNPKQMTTCFSALNPDPAYNPTTHANCVFGQLHNYPASGREPGGADQAAALLRSADNQDALVMPCPPCASGEPRRPATSPPMWEGLSESDENEPNLNFKGPSEDTDNTDDMSCHQWIMSNYWKQYEMEPPEPVPSTSPPCPCSCANPTALCPGSTASYPDPIAPCHAANIDYQTQAEIDNPIHYYTPIYYVPINYSTDENVPKVHWALGVYVPGVGYKLCDWPERHCVGNLPVNDARSGPRVEHAVQTPCSIVGGLGFPDMERRRPDYVDSSAFLQDFESGMVLGGGRGRGGDRGPKN